MLAVDGVRECGSWWAGPLDARSPHLSPLYADLAGLPSTAYFQGTHDILVVDARSFASKAEAAGMDLRYFEYPGAFHVFMGATFTPEARDVFRHVATFLDD